MDDQDGAGDEAATRTLTARLADRNDGSEALRPRTASGLSNPSESKPTQLKGKRSLVSTLPFPLPFPFPLPVPVPLPLPFPSLNDFKSDGQASVLSVDLSGWPKPGGQNNQTTFHYRNEPIVNKIISRPAIKQIKQTKTQDNNYSRGILALPGK